MKNIKIFPVFLIWSTYYPVCQKQVCVLNFVDDKLPFLNSARKRGRGWGTFYNRRSSLNLHDSPISYVLPFLVIDKRDDIFINDLPSMIMIVIITILTFSESCCKAASLSLIFDGTILLLDCFHLSYYLNGSFIWGRL